MTQKAHPLELSQDQRSGLEELNKSPRKRLAKRASIILAVATEGMTHDAVAERLGTIPTIVRKWRIRFEAKGLPGRSDAPREGTPKEQCGDCRTHQQAHAKNPDQPGYRWAGSGWLA